MLIVKIKNAKTNVKVLNNDIQFSNLFDIGNLQASEIKKKSRSRLKLSKITRSWYS